MIIEVDLQSSATLVFSYKERAYQTILEEMHKSRRILITTYNLHPDGELLALLKALPATVEVAFFTSIPSRFPRYFTSDARSHAKEQIDDYLEALHPKNFKCQLRAWYCTDNHSKIIATEACAYVGSQNFADRAIENIESGILIKGEKVVKKVMTGALDLLVPNSEEYAGHAKDRFLILCRAFYRRIRTSYRQVSSWFEMRQDSHTLESVEKLNFPMVEFAPLAIEDLEDVIYDLEEISGELWDADCFDEIAAQFDSLPFQAAHEIATAEDLYEYMKHSPGLWMSSYMEDNATDDVDYDAQAAAEAEREVRDQIASNAEELISQLRSILEKLLAGLEQIACELKQISVPRPQFDNTDRA